MLKGKTKSGFKYSVNENVKNDIRVLECVLLIENHASNDDVLNGYLTLYNLILGVEQKTALYDHVAKKNGGVADITQVQEEFSEIYEALGGENALKKSGTSPES